MSLLSTLLYDNTPRPIPDGVGRLRELWDDELPKTEREIKDEGVICASCRVLRTLEEMHILRSGHVGKLCNKCTEYNNDYRARKKGQS